MSNLPDNSQEQLVSFIQSFSDPDRLSFNYDDLLEVTGDPLKFFDLFIKMIALKDDSSKFCIFLLLTYPN